MYIVNYKMKSQIKNALERLGLLRPAQEIHYRLSFLNKSSTHPGKLVFQFYRQFIKKKQLVFDIGANIGDRVAVFDKLGAVIIAVEPQGHCVRKMQERFLGYKNVHLEHAGLGEETGEMDFYICDDDDRLSTFSKDQMENSFFSGSTRWNRKEIVRIITIESLITAYGVPSFCKIDVEGFELDVLKGLKTPIPALSFEFSSKQLDKLKACMSLLKTIEGDYQFNVCFGEPYNLYFKEWVGEKDILNAIEQEDKVSQTHAWGDIYAKRSTTN
jgi:FkbM family methyltransferase